MNHIHNWFVNNVQNGEDDCREYEVTFEQIEELIKLCKEVLTKAKTNKPLPKDGSVWEDWEQLTIENKGELDSLLPTSSGFFFGNTDYDGDYLYGVKQTIEQLEPLVEKDDKGEYQLYGDLYYHASW